MSEVITDCPNCQIIWGFEEMQWGECDCCGYPNVASENKPNESECINCETTIQIAEEADEMDRKNAINAYADEDCKFIGGICLECADLLCNKGKGSISGGGGLAPEFYFL